MPSAASICTDINRLFGDMTADNAATLKDMRSIARHAANYATMLEEASAENEGVFYRDDDIEFEDDDLDYTGDEADFDDDDGFGDDFGDEFDD